LWHTRAAAAPHRVFCRGVVWWCGLADQITILIATIVALPVDADEHTQLGPSGVLLFRFQCQKMNSKP